MQHLAKRAVTVLFLLVLPWADAVGQAGTPRALIERLNQTLLEVMQNANQLGFQGRYGRLAPVLTSTYDLPTMVRYAVGPSNFDAFDPAQRQRLIDTYTRMSITTYAARFDGYSGERFEIVGEEPGPRNAVLVKTRLVRPAGEPISLNYVVRQTNAGWRVLDVFLEGTVSELSRQRSEYAATLRREGFDGLIAAIEAATTRLAGPQPARR